MIKGIIFDMDGVLIDSELYYMKRIIAILDSNFNINITLNDLAKLPGGNSTHLENVLNTILKPKGISFAEYKKVEYANYKNNPVDYSQLLNPHVKNVLTWLKEQNFKVSIASSSSSQEIQTMLEQNNLHHYFDFIIGGDMVKKTKPDPEIYIKSIKMMNFNPNELIVIEDSEYGIQAAKNASLLVIAKKDKHFIHNQLLADKRVCDLIEIIPIIKELQQNEI